MYKHVATSLVLVLLALGAPAIGGDAAKEDAKEIQGTWKVVGAEVDAKKIDPEVLKDVQFIFKGDIVIYQSTREKNSAKFKLDAGKKPRRLDSEVLDGESKGQVRLAIYELSGNTLKLCWSKSTTRPAEFATKAGDTFINLQLERVKE